MHDLLAQPGPVHQFQRNIVILPARQAGPQRRHPHREREAHLNPRIEAFQIALVVIQRGLDHLEAEAAFGMGIEGPHDAAHVDALFLGIQADRASDTGFQRKVATVAGVIAQRQAEIRNPHMLDLLLGPLDQAGRTILQIRQRGLVGIACFESIRIGAAVGRVGRTLHKTGNGRIQGRDIDIRRCIGPLPQHGKRRFGLVPAWPGVDDGGPDIHAVRLFGSQPDPPDGDPMQLFQLYHQYASATGSDHSQSTLKIADQIVGVFQPDG